MLALAQSKIGSKVEENRKARQNLFYVLLNNIQKYLLKLDDHIRKNIFRDTTEKENLVDRLDHLIPQTETSCYAWVLLSNHAHFLFRSGPDGLFSLTEV